MAEDSSGEYVGIEKSSGSSSEYIRTAIDSSTDNHASSWNSEQHCELLLVIQRLAYEQLSHFSDTLCLSTSHQENIRKCSYGQLAFTKANY